MISAHTPPGTKVAFIHEPVNAILGVNQTQFKAGDIVTVREITPFFMAVSGFAVSLIEADRPTFDLSLFRRLDLPECLTDLLQSKPVDALVGLSASPDLHPHSTPANNGLDRPRDVHCKPTAYGLRVMLEPYAFSSTARSRD